MTTSFVQGDLTRLRDEGLHRHLRDLESAPGPRVRWKGRDHLQLASNSYLGLATHPDVVAAARSALDAWGTGAGGARFLSGSTTPQRELEAALARLKGTQDAVLFPSGYHANLGTVGALVGRGDLIVSDGRNHASLIDACRLSRAQVRVVPHADTAAAEQVLRAERGAFRRCLLLTDGVFSMDGDVAPLRAWAELARSFEATLMVDDAHGTGVLGERGAGSVEATGTQGRVDVQMGTLSKALASQGGFIAADADVCDLVRNRARSFLFSTASAPAAVAAAHAALLVVEREPERRERLARHQARLRTGLRGLGYDVPEGTTPIVPVRVGPIEAALSLAARLEAQGVFLPAVRPPTVPPGDCRLRASLMSTHTELDLEAALVAFSLARGAEVTPWAPASL